MTASRTKLTVTVEVDREAWATAHPESCESAGAADVIRDVRETFTAQLLEDAGELGVKLFIA